MRGKVARRLRKQVGGQELSSHRTYDWKQVGHTTNKNGITIPTYIKVCTSEGRRRYKEAKLRFLA